MTKETTGKPRPVKDKRIGALRRFAMTITVFTVVGHLWLGMETPWSAPVAALITAYLGALVLEAVEAATQQRRPAFAGGLTNLVNFLLPAHIAALAIALLIYPGARLWPFVLATIIAVSAKYLLRAPVNGRMRHFMNPSNLGISAVLVMFPWTGIAMPYHFTEPFSGALDWIIPLLLLASGLMLNLQLTGKWPLIAGWTAGFVGQAVVRAGLTDVSLLGALAPITGVAFILFTNYMITDPGTSPVRPRNQVFFGLATAAAYGAFMVAHIAFGIFFGLTVVCALRGLWLWGVALAGKRVRATATVPARPSPSVPAVARATSSPA